MNEETRFNDLVFKALDHAIDSVSGGEVLVPFVMTENSLQRFVTDKIEDGKDAAEKYIEEQRNTDNIVMAYDGFLTVEGKKDEAVFVKGFDRINNKKLVLAQRYERPITSSEKQFRKIGNPVLLEQG